MMEPTFLSKEAAFVLDWLGKCAAIKGECRGASLDQLERLGLVEITPDTQGRGDDYAIVRISEAGVAQLAWTRK